VAGTDFDQVPITGLATLGGAIHVSLIQNVAPQTGDKFKIMPFGTESSDFSSRTGFNLGNALVISEVFNFINPQDLSLVVNAAHLHIQAEPTNTVAGQPINGTTGVTVNVVDLDGNPDTADNVDQVTLTLNGVQNQFEGGVTSVTQTVVAGVATFVGLKIDVAANNYTLSAGGNSFTGSNGDTSSSFNITPAVATKLTFQPPGQQPATTAFGSNLGTVKAALEDQFGNVETGDSSSTMNLVLVNPNGNGAVLGGTLPQTVNAGIASFGNLSVSKVGTNYQLTASSSLSNVSNATSNAFAITALSTTVTAANAAQQTYSTANQANITLSAVVTSSNSAVVVNEGSVQFVVKDSNQNQIGSTVSGTVNGTGNASASFTLPGGTKVGTYTVVATYVPQAVNPDFTAGHPDSSHTLVVVKAGTSIGPNPASAGVSASNQVVTLTATVTSLNSTAPGVVNEGSVQFVVNDNTAQHNQIGNIVTVAVDANGNATTGTQYVLPGGTAAGTYTITASYLPQASNPDFTTSSGQNTLTVTQGILPPTANSQTLTLGQGVATAVTLTGSDPNTPPQLPLTFGVVTNPTHGALSGTAPNVTYTPNGAFFGTDSFTFQATNQAGVTSTSNATVTLIVVGKPTANAQSLTTGQNTALAVTLTGSDPNSPPRALTFSVSANPTHGLLSGTVPNLTYTPNTGFSGPDSFQFKVNNGVQDSNIATISINVVAQTAGAHFVLILQDPNNASSQIVVGDEAPVGTSVVGPGGAALTTNAGDQASGVPGMILYAQPIGAFGLDITVALSKPLLAGTPTLFVNSLLVSSGSGALKILTSDTGYSPSALVPATLSSPISGVAFGSTVTFQEFVDANNTPFGTTQTPGLQGPFGGGAFADSRQLSVSLTSSPFSITKVVNVTSGAGAFASVSALGVVQALVGADPGLQALVQNALFADPLVARELGEVGHTAAGTEVQDLPAELLRADVRPVSALVEHGQVGVEAGALPLARQALWLPTTTPSLLRDRNAAWGLEHRLGFAADHQTADGVEAAWLGQGSITAGRGSPSRSEALPATSMVPRVNTCTTPATTEQSHGVVQRWVVTIEAGSGMPASEGRTGQLTPMAEASQAPSPRLEGGVLAGLMASLHYCFAFLHSDKKAARRDDAWFGRVKRDPNVGDDAP
jgi:hypothetical protein